MRTSIKGCLLTAFGLLAPGQPATQTSQEQVFHFAHAQTSKSANEIATVIRTTAEMSVKASDDNPPSTVTVRGTSDQVALATWLFVELDQRTGPPRNAATREYKLPGGGENVVHIYYVTNAETVQQFQEIASSIRTAVEVRRVSTYNETRAMVARGTPDQMKMTEWLVPLMDKPLHQPVQHSTSPEGLIPDPRQESVTQVFYVANAPAVKDFQELATTIRAIAQVRRVFTYNDARAMVVRGLAGQLAMTTWLFNELDQPGSTQTAAPGSSARPYQVAGHDDYVRVFYFVHGIHAQDLQNIVAQIHASTNVQRAFGIGLRMGLVLRGTAAQLASVERLVQELDKP